MRSDIDEKAPVFAASPEPIEVAPRGADEAGLLVYVYMLAFVTKGAEGGLATLEPVLRSHVGLLSAGAWNKHE